MARTRRATLHCRGWCLESCRARTGAWAALGCLGLGGAAGFAQGGARGSRPAATGCPVAEGCLAARAERWRPGIFAGRRLQAAASPRRPRPSARAAAAAARPWGPLRRGAAAAAAWNALGAFLTLLIGNHVLFDFVGGTAFALAALAALPRGWQAAAPRQRLALGLVVGWAARIAPFLLIRALAMGPDPRLTPFMERPVGFVVLWALNAIWAWMTLLAHNLLAGRPADAPGMRLGAVGWLSAAAFAAGLGIETVADLQRSAFREAHRGVAGAFCDVGLWRLSRHPNYFGEILAWSAMCALALPALRAGPSERPAAGRLRRLAALLSPLFLSWLLLCVSGVPTAERRADALFGSDPAYLAYKDRTPVLIPDVRLLWRAD